MDLEQRVQALEQEVEILKSQIQVTLLAIQEQLLNQRYPTLHGEELVVNEVAEREPQPQAAVNLIKRVSLNPNAAAPEAAPVTHSDMDTQPAKDWSLITRLEKWAAEKIDKIGAKRTRELLKLYEKQGRISPQICDELIQFVEIYETGESHKPATSPKAAVPNAKLVHAGTAETSKDERWNAYHQPEDKRTLVLRLIDGLQNGGKARRTG